MIDSLSWTRGWNRSNKEVADRADEMLSLNAKVKSHIE